MKKVLSLNIGTLTVLVVLALSGQTIAGDVEFLRGLGEVQPNSPFPTITVWRDSLAVCLYVRAYPPKDSTRVSRAYRLRQLEYTEIGTESGAKVSTYLPSGPDGRPVRSSVDPPAFAMKNEKGHTFIGLTLTHRGLQLIILNPGGEEVFNKMTKQMSPGLMLTSFAPDGDLIICGWGNNTQFLRVRSNGRQEAFGSKQLREDYFVIGSKALNRPKFISVLGGRSILLGSCLTNYVRGKKERTREYDTLGLCIYDPEADKITSYQEYDLSKHAAVQLTDIPCTKWQAFTDSLGVTTICGSYRNEEDDARMFLLAVDKNLNPIEMPRRRVEQFEDEAGFDRSSPHRHIYYFENGPRFSVWLHHVITTPEVIYHAEYETINYQPR